jgi:hypothetical protein
MSLTLHWESGCLAVLKLPAYAYQFTRTNEERFLDYKTNAFAGANAKEKSVGLLRPE